MGRERNDSKDEQDDLRRFVDDIERKPPAGPPPQDMDPRDKESPG